MKAISNEEVDLLRHNARNVVRELGLLNDTYFDIGVTLAERHLLIELSACLYPTISEIAERLLLDKSTASRLISKAVRKGYVKYSSDESDKRKRFLQFTEKGREVLNAFEPIAFNQTKEALLTLTDEEITTVYQGIALYAKGLRISRLRNKVTITQIVQQDNAKLAHLFADIYKKQHSYEQKKDREWMHLFEAYQGKGFSYFVMKMKSKIVGGIGIAPYQPYQSIEVSSCELRKICLRPDMVGFGFEQLLIDFCIKKAKKLGYSKCYVDIGKEFALPVDVFEQQGFQFTKKNKQKASILWKAC